MIKVKTRILRFVAWALLLDEYLVVVADGVHCRIDGRASSSFRERAAGMLVADQNRAMRRRFLTKRF